MTLHDRSLKIITLQKNIQNHLKKDEVCAACQIKFESDTPCYFLAFIHFLSVISFFINFFLFHFLNLFLIFFLFIFLLVISWKL